MCYHYPILLEEVDLNANSLILMIGSNNIDKKVEICKFSRLLL
jgi:hypothetical protein